MRRLLLVLGLIAACGDGDGGDPEGHETGPCDPNGTCNEGLVCGSEVCVDLDGSASATEGEGPGPGGRPDSGDDHDDGGGNPGDGNPDDDGNPGEDAGDTWGDDDGSDPGEGEGGGGVEIYCRQDEEYPDTCWCGHSADWGFAGESCAPAVVGSPSKCCASESTWPDNGTCACTKMYCGQTYDRCFCNTVEPDPEDIPPETPVDTCTAAEGGVCCKDQTTGWCLCWDDLPYCLDDDEVEVASCSVSSVDCGDSHEVGQCA